MTANTPRRLRLIKQRLRPLELPMLADMLRELPAAGLDEAHRMVRVAVIETICERSLAASQALQAWAENDEDTDPDEVILAAVSS